MGTALPQSALPQSASSCPPLPLIGTATVWTSPLIPMVSLVSSLVAACNWVLCVSKEALHAHCCSSPAAQGCITLVLKAGCPYNVVWHSAAHTFTPVLLTHAASKPAQICWGTQSRCPVRPTLPQVAMGEPCTAHAAQLKGSTLMIAARPHNSLPAQSVLWNWMFWRCRHSPPQGQQPDPCPTAGTDSHIPGILWPGAHPPGNHCSR